jgi:cell division protein FtsI/penicillin-binding protein 2
MRVTPLQLARGMAAFANGGKRVDPRIVRGTVDESGATRPMPKSEAAQLDAAKSDQVIDADTAAQVRRILCDVMIRGTASRARSGVYNLFGKTGTAHSAVNGQYNESNYTSSFVGGGPYESPRLVIAMVIHDPDKSQAHFGGTVAAPAASVTLERSLQYLQVAPSGDLPLPPLDLQDKLYAYDAKLYAKPKEKPKPEVE